MTATTIIGIQWGDEGKGKIVDYLTTNADYVVRFHGGNNAGHTLVVNGIKTKLNLIPSGILRPKTKCLIGAGVVLDGMVFLDEVKNLSSVGVDASSDKISIDIRAELLLSYHREIDLAREEYLGKSKIGTTGRGVGPAYEDKTGRMGVKAFDLLDLNSLQAKLVEIVKLKNRYLEHVLQSERRINFDKVWEDVKILNKNLVPYFKDVSAILVEAFHKAQKVVFEGAQGTLLDNTYGTVPFVTSSSTIAGAVSVGCGIGPKYTGHVLGITKAYSTRVGSGPFPTELLDKVGDTLREQGGEFGTVTGRPRRCGWLDAFAVKYAVELSGADSLAITKLDVLAGLDKIKVCYGYEINGKSITRFPASASELEKCTPKFAEFDGWDSSVASARKWHHLPSNAKLYLSTISEIIGSPVSLVSVGAERDATIISSHGTDLSIFT